MKKFVAFFDNIIVKIIMSVIPTTWFAFFSIFATQTVAFINDQGKLTPLSITLNIVMITIMFLFAIGITIEQFYERSNGIKSEKMFDCILSKIDEGNKALQNIQKDELNRSVTDKLIINQTNYKNMITMVLGNLLTCLSEITQVGRKKFVATYFYKQKSESEWKSMSSDEGFKGVKQADLLKNKNSVVGQLIPNYNTIFYPSKEKAIQNDNYVPDNRDEREKSYGHPMGSIFGANWRVTDINGKTIFDNIITIATYGEEICSEKDIVTKQAIIESVLKVFSQQFWQIAFSFNLIAL